MSESEQRVKDAVDAVWQTQHDNVLRNLRPPGFYHLIRTLDMTHEEREDAWYAFEERQKHVTAEGGWNE